MLSSLYKRDVAGFFYSPSAYFIFAVYAVLSAIVSIFWGSFFVSPNQLLLSYFAFQPQILVMIIPVITMRSWAEEQKGGTMENLLTYPLSNWSMVWSKYAAALTINFSLFLFSLPFLITAAFYLKMEWGAVFCSYLGCFATMMVLTAAGCLLSLCTATPAVAYLLGLLFGILWINFNFGRLLTAVWKNAPFYFCGALDFERNFQLFLNGQISLSAIFYFASLCGLLLFFNWLLISQRRAEQ